MARSLMNQLQMSGSLTYTDAATPGLGMVSAQELQADLNNIRALVKDIKGGSNWYDAAPAAVQLSDLDRHLDASSTSGIFVVKSDIKSDDAMAIYTQSGNVSLYAVDAAAFAVVEDVKFKASAISEVATIAAKAATDLELQAASGQTIKLNINGGAAELQVAGTQVTVVGNFVVQGTTVTVDAETSVVKDPIFQLGGESDGAGGVVAPTTDDNKDRGLSFQWHNGTAAKVGFFGFDDSTGKFTFVPEATITSEVVAGTRGGLDAGASSFGDVQVDVNDGYVESINSKQLKLKSDLNAVFIDDAAEVNGMLSVVDTGVMKFTADQAGNFWSQGKGTVSGALTVSGSLDLSNAAKIVEIKGADAAALAFKVGAQAHLVLDTAGSALKLVGNRLELQDAGGARKGRFATYADGAGIYADAKLQLSGTHVQVSNAPVELLAAGAHRVSFKDGGGNEKAYIEKDATGNLVMASLAAEILLDDKNRADAALATLSAAYNGGIKLSDTAAEWEAFEDTFGTKSLIAALTAAGGGSATRADEIKTAAPGAIAISGMDLTAIPSAARGARVQVYLNGVLQKPTADYAITSATELTFTYGLSADLVTVLYR